jgi:hypothetical protein
MGTFGIALYLLALLTSVACMVLLFRAYAASKARLLLWSALCFVGLTVSNLALFIDLLILPDIDLRPLRLGATLVGLSFLIYGFVWEAE